ncbi:MAG TPA: LytTR family DNA-binding domain-containing protein [Bacteroidia bacterium]|nr:LytTR family DNA-binding domain-containing protein [Bacteroidia bacterium]
MIHAVIIDDEQKCIETLSILIKMHCPEITIDASCNNGSDGIKAINQHKPDVVFLDIEMPKMNGFDMLEKFEKIFFHVVFTTAYNQFAIKAFRYSALNYLLKPIDPDDLKSTVSRIKELKGPGFNEQFEILMQNIKSNNKPQRIALSTGDGLVFVNTKDIMYCHSESNYTHVLLTGGEKYLLAKTIKEFEDTLSEDNFFRIHNSYVVNLDQIKKFVRGDGGYVVMKDGTSITIARARREEFFSLFDKF